MYNVLKYYTVREKLDYINKQINFITYIHEYDKFLSLKSCANYWSITKSRVCVNLVYLLSRRYQHITVVFTGVWIQRTPLLNYILTFLFDSDQTLFIPEYLYIFISNTPEYYFISLPNSIRNTSTYVSVASLCADTFHPTVLLFPLDTLRYRLLRAENWGGRLSPGDKFTLSTLCSCRHTSFTCRIAAFNLKRIKEKCAWNFHFYRQAYM